MNNVSISGRLTKNPETRYGGQDSSVAISRFTLAVDDYNETDFISVRCLGRTAEWVEKWLSKGSKVEITGKIKTGNYTNRDGAKVYYTEVMANNVGFGESKAEAVNRQQAAGQELPASSDSDGFMHIPDGIDEELPFH